MKKNDEKSPGEKYSDAVTMVCRLTGAETAFVFVANGDDGTGYGLDRETFADPKRRRQLAQTLALIALRLSIVDVDPAELRWLVAKPRRPTKPQHEELTRCPNCQDTTTGCDDDDEMGEGDEAICLGCATPLIVTRSLESGHLEFRIASPEELSVDARGFLDDLLRRRGQA